MRSDADRREAFDRWARDEHRVAFDHWALEGRSHVSWGMLPRRPSTPDERIAERLALGAWLDRWWTQLLAIEPHARALADRDREDLDDWATASVRWTLAVLGDFRSALRVDTREAARKLWRRYVGASIPVPFAPEHRHALETYAHPLSPLWRHRLARTLYETIRTIQRAPRRRTIEVIHADGIAKSLPALDVAMVELVAAYSAHTGIGLGAEEARRRVRAVAKRGSAATARKATCNLLRFPDGRPTVRVADLTRDFPRSERLA